MGLEDVELMMRLEEEFLIEWTDEFSERWDGTVGDIVEEIIVSMDLERPRHVLQVAEESTIPRTHRLKRAEYKAIAAQARFLPSVIFRAPRQYRTLQDIIDAMSAKLAPEDLTRPAIEQRVMRHVREVLDFDGEISLQDNIYKDLGAG